MLGAFDAHLSTLPLPEVIGLLRSDEHDARSSAAATEILRRFQPLLRKYWLGRRAGEYEDFVQEAMVRLFIALPKLRDAAAFPGLFRRIVIGTAADTLKGMRELDTVYDVSEDELALEFDHAISTAVVVRSYLEELSPREREVVELSFFEDLSAAEVALRLGVSEGSARMTKSRAVARLRTILVKVTDQSRGG